MSRSQRAPTSYEPDIADLPLGLFSAGTGTAVAVLAAAGRASGEQVFHTTRNALLGIDAERDYRTMHYGSCGSWDLRDRHMDETYPLGL